MSMFTLLLLGRLALKLADDSLNGCSAGSIPAPGAKGRADARQTGKESHMDTIRVVETSDMVFETALQANGTWQTVVTDKTGREIYRSACCDDADTAFDEAEVAVTTQFAGDWIGGIW